MAFGLALLRGRVDYTDKVSEVVYNCNLCGACDVSCKYAMDMDVLEPLYAVRQECVKQSSCPPVFETLVTKMQRQGPMVLGAEGRERWYAGLDVKDCTKEKVQTVYHAGCHASCSAASGRVARAAVSLLQRAGVDVGIAIDSELCCGGRSYEMGYEEAFRAQAERNLEQLEASGAIELVTACAHCYQYYKVLYDKLGLSTNVTVLHTSQYLSRLLGSGQLQPNRSLDLTVTYHDPCHLGRLSEPWIHWQGVQREKHMRVYDPPRVFRRGESGVYDPPREILRSIPGVRLVEMERIREYAWCCGAGGGVKESNPEFAEWTAAERLDEAESTGAQALVTACPHCVQNLQSARGTHRTLEVYDVVELLSQAT